MPTVNVDVSDSGAVDDSANAGRQALITLTDTAVGTDTASVEEIDGTTVDRSFLYQPGLLAALRGALGTRPSGNYSYYLDLVKSSYTPNRNHRTVAEITVPTDGSYAPVVVVSVGNEFDQDIDLAGNSVYLGLTDVVDFGAVTGSEIVKAVALSRGQGSATHADHELIAYFELLGGTRTLDGSGLAVSCTDTEGAVNAWMHLKGGTTFYPAALSAAASSPYGSELFDSAAADGVDIGVMLLQETVTFDSTHETLEDLLTENNEISVSGYVRQDVTGTPGLRPSDLTVPELFASVVNGLTWTGLSSGSQNLGGLIFYIKDFGGTGDAFNIPIALCRISPVVSLAIGGILRLQMPTSSTGTPNIYSRVTTTAPLRGGSSSPDQDYYTSATSAFVQASDDQEVVLRGFNSRTDAVTFGWSQSRWDEFAARPSLAGTDNNWDFVRLAVNWPEIESTRGVYTPANLDTAISRAKTAGLKVILDPAHIKSGTSYAGSFPSWVPRGSNYHTVRDLLADPSSDGNYILGYWRYICDRYASDRDVIAIDLLNEPGYGSLANDGWPPNNELLQMFRDAITDLRSGSDLTKGKILMLSNLTGGTSLASITEEQHTHISTNYTARLINWSVDFPFSVRDNVVLTFHTYYGGGGTEPGGSVGTSNNGFSSSGYVDGNDLSSGAATPDYNGNSVHLASHIAQFKAWCDVAGLPLFIGEYGISGLTANKLAWITDLSSVLDTYGISRSWWEIATGDSPPQLNLNVVGTSTWDDTRLTYILSN